ncbi:MAG: hypothetical protein B6I36_01355 [Desulfobacteraceae bacterium 4572_35.1]|nr:MAG: hypothetical protein B6I36_01355 [Desulfobacteraceae bacterium 4572_35.1]
MLCLLCFLSNCVSKDAYQSAVNQSADLSLEMAQQRLQLAQLQNDIKNLNNQLAECAGAKANLEQQALEASAEVERQANIYRVRQAKNKQQQNKLQQKIQTIEHELQRTLERYKQLEILNDKQNNTIVELENNLQREQIARQARIAKIASTYKKLVESLENEIHSGEVTISKLKNRLSVNLVQEILFPSGSALLSSTGEKVIRQVGDILKGIEDKNIRVEGHSDNLKIRPSLQQKFPSNWELSAARAATVVRFLQKEVGIPGKKLAIGAYSSYRPIANNSTPEGRAKNRRIQIVLVPLDM